MNQKGFAPILVLAGVLVTAAVLFTPIPYYQKEDVICESWPPQKCPPKGWHLGLPLWKRILPLAQEKAVSQPTIQTSLSPTDASPAPTGAGETANWKTYANSAFKYQLKYPNNYEVVPQTDGQRSQLGEGQNMCIAKKGLEDCKLIINAFSLKDYKLIDYPGGFAFYFDVDKKQWLHDEVNKPSQFVPKRVNSPYEAYLYKTGDVKCSTEMILILDSGYTSLVEINNITCKDDEGNILEGYSDISSKQILSTFKFTQ